jgi:hypothetical protein
MNCQFFKPASYFSSRTGESEQGAQTPNGVRLFPWGGERGEGTFISGDKAEAFMIKKKVTLFLVRFWVEVPVVKKENAFIPSFAGGSPGLEEGERFSTDFG